MKSIPRLAILTGALLALLGVGLITGSSDRAGGGLQVPGIREPAPGALRGVSRGVAALRFGPRVAAAISDVLPGISGPVADWRAFDSAVFAVRLAPDLVLPFRVTQVQRGNGRTVLTARIDRDAPVGSGLDGAFLVSTANTPDAWEAVVVLPGEEYRVHVEQNQASVEPVSVDGWKCGTGLQLGPADSARLGALEPPVAAANAADQPSTGAADSATVYTVDVLFLYNADALAAKNGNRAVIDADCSNFIAAGNAILESSGITNFRWNYLLAEAAPAYAATGKLADDLDQVTTGSISAFTAREQTTYGADQVVLLVGGKRSDAAGMAWIGGNPNRVAVVYPCLTVDGTVASTATSVIVVCHEMGHNFGCRHDRATEAAADGDGHCCYGFRFADNSGAYAVADEGTVMSYAGSRIPYFSNPNIIYHGYTLGVPAGQPRAADNAYTMTGNAARIAATNAPRLEPTITGQPQSASVQVGQPLSLAVTATGSSLTFQWFKGGTAIPSATSATYSVSSAALGDAGTYTVTASNPLGSASSDPASVTVSPAAASPAPASASAVATGGGSSGGGALDAPFVLGLLALLALGRARRR